MIWEILGFETPSIFANSLMFLTLPDSNKFWYKFAFLNQYSQDLPGLISDNILLNNKGLNEIDITQEGSSLDRYGQPFP